MSGPSGPDPFRPGPGRPPLVEPGRPPLVEPGRPPLVERGRPPLVERGRPPLVERGRPPLVEPGLRASAGPSRNHPHHPNPARPATVWVAVVALGLAALGAVAQMMIAVIAFNTVDRAVKVNGQWMHVADHYRTMSGWAVTLLALIALLFAIGYAALAFFAWRGAPWPRYVVSVLAVFSLFGLLGGPVILVMVAAGVLAAVMLWLPSAHHFCAAVALSKAPPAANPFAQPPQQFRPPQQFGAQQFGPPSRYGSPQHGSQQFGARPPDPWRR